MDTTTHYLRLKIAEWQLGLAGTSLEIEDQEELTAHLEDVLQDIGTLKLEPKEVWALAMGRIGNISAIEEEFGKVAPDKSFRKNGLFLIYGAVLMLLLQSVFIVAPAYFYRSYLGDNLSQHLNNDFNWPVLFTSLIIILLIIILLLITKGKTITKSLSKLIIRANILSSVASILIVATSGFLIIQFLNLTAIDSDHTVTPIFKLLTQIFYFALICIIIYFLLLNNDPSPRTFRAFNRKITWKTALILGLITCFSIVFSFTYGVPLLPVIIGCPVFGVLGWMIGFSTQKFLNLFCTQFFLMLFWISELGSQHADLFTRNYLLTIASLFAGCFFQKISTNSPFKALDRKF